MLHGILEDCLQRFLLCSEVAQNVVAKTIIIWFVMTLWIDWPCGQFFQCIWQLGFLTWSYHLSAQLERTQCLLILLYSSLSFVTERRLLSKRDISVQVSMKPVLTACLIMSLCTGGFMMKPTVHAGRTPQGGVIRCGPLMW